MGRLCVRRFPTAAPIAVLSVGLVCGWAEAQEVVGGSEQAPAVDKSRFHLFNPTPRELMRELSADRPDTTESPYTVDAGHFQIEASFFDYTRDDTGPDTEAILLLPFNLKIGLLNNVDLQLVNDPYVKFNAEGSSGVELDAEGPDDVDLDAEGSGDVEGFGNTQLRLKINLWGNDGGPTAFAFMPFIQFPTGEDGLSTDHLEGGLIFPFATELPAGFGLGLMGEVDFVRSSGNDGYEVDFLHTAVLGRDLAGDLGGYVEYIGIVPGEDGSDYIAVLGVGLTYRLGPDTQLDVGANVGLTDDADDFNVFTGITFRL